MGKIYSLISALLMAAGVAYAATPDGYEWWIDNDVSDIRTGTFSGDGLDFLVDTSGLPNGFHYFNCRLTASDGTYGTVYRRLFHSSANAKPAISYEYWIDNDFSTRQSGSIADKDSFLDIDFGAMPYGAHYFNCRLGYADGRWGTPFSRMVLNLSGDADATAYECWIDNDYELRQEGAFPKGGEVSVINLDGVKRGLHRFCYRVCNSRGRWGTIFMKYFYANSLDDRFTDYEYWFDKDYAGRKTGDATRGVAEFDIDLSGFDKSGGAHYFNLRARDVDGKWSPVYRKLLVFRESPQIPLLGYRHYLNNVDLGYETLDRKLVDHYMYEVEVPDSLVCKVRDLVPVFNGDEVSLSGGDSISYTVYPQTELGWSTPKTWKIEISNPFSTRAVALDVNASHTLDVPAADQFAAVKFTSEGDTLFISADIPVALDIYRYGEKVRTLDLDSLTRKVALLLERGEYYGILRDARSDRETFTLRLTDDNNRLPAPEISYVDDLVHIYCAREDVEIRYTLDGSMPGDGSLLYTGPFRVAHNCTVKAMAMLPGSDIMPSTVTDYVISGFVTANPTASYDPESQLLTFECATPEAEIWYSFDLDNWILYETPVTMTRNCTVYFKAQAFGFDVSDICEIYVYVGEMKCGPVTVSYNGRYVTLTPSDADADVYYSLDGTDPRSGYRYGGAFDAMGLCTVRAVAVMPDYTDSEVMEYQLEGYADESHAETARTGVLESCYAWAGIYPEESMQKLSVEGYLGDTDYAFIRRMKALLHIDLEKVRAAAIPDFAFSRMPLISASLPADLVHCGDTIFSLCRDISSVVWNSDSVDVTRNQTYGLMNPNMLLYVNPGVAVDKWREFDFNVVEGGRSEGITLKGAYPFYASRDFSADSISYTRSFSKPTEIDVCGGWETLTLPFDVDIVYNADGELRPFASAKDEDRPFWLYRPSGLGWEAAPAIESYRPYIISMPNSPDYIDIYNVVGDVTFKTRNAFIGATPDLDGEYFKEGMIFRPNFMRKPADGTFLAINHDWHEADRPGSVFLRGLQDVNPFECLLIADGPVSRVPVFDGSGVEGLAAETGLKIWKEGSDICILSRIPRRVGIYDTVGQLVRQVETCPGETVRVSGLTPGIYLVDRQKLLIH